MYYGCSFLLPVLSKVRIFRWMANNDNPSSPPLLRRNWLTENKQLDVAVIISEVRMKKKPTRTRPKLGGSVHLNDTRKKNLVPVCWRRHLPLVKGLT